MYLFIIGDFFRRRRGRRAPADDPLPMQPLLQAVLFWMFFGTGALAGALAIAGFFVSEGDTFTRSVIVGAAVISLACLAGTFAMWRRLTR